MDDPSAVNEEGAEVDEELVRCEPNARDAHSCDPPSHVRADVYSALNYRCQIRHAYPLGLPQSFLVDGTAAKADPRALEDGSPEDEAYRMRSPSPARNG